MSKDILENKRGQARTVLDRRGHFRHGGWNMEHTFTMLFSTLIGSTIWTQESKETKLVWITMLAMADANGVVRSSIPGLANFAGVEIAECESALIRLKSPDPYSRTPDNEGRRIKDIEGGWVILNHGKYKGIRKREIERERWRRNKELQREREKLSNKEDLIRSHKAAVTANQNHIRSLSNSADAEF